MHEDAISLGLHFPSSRDAIHAPFFSISDQELSTAPHTSNFTLQPFSPDTLFCSGFFFSFSLSLFNFGSDHSKSSVTEGLLSWHLPTTALTNSQLSSTIFMTVQQPFKTRAELFPSVLSPFADSHQHKLAMSSH